MEPRFPASSQLEGAQRIGSGGCGTVYSASHSEWGRVAVKIANSADGEFRRLFLAEYTLLRSFRHRAILKAHDFFFLEDQRSVIVMQLCDGGDLYQAADGLGTRSRFRSLGQVLSAIEYLHLLGLVHRDLKGENILISSRAGPQLSDLGLATAVGEDSRERGGTLEYMAPEVIANQGATMESDIYSLGIILYRLATGALPYASSDPVQVISRKQEPDSLPFEALADLVSARFARLVRQCLDPNPAERPKSVKDVAEQLTLDRLIQSEDFGNHRFIDFFHRYIYSYNASFCKQELRDLSEQLVIAHQFQDEAAELRGSIADYLKQAGYIVSIAGDEMQYSRTGQSELRRIMLVSRDSGDHTIGYNELDRFAFDATMARIIRKEIEPETAELIFDLTSGNIALVNILINQLEGEGRFDVRSGRLKLTPMECSYFRPNDTYFQLAARMMPPLPDHLRDSAGFLATDSGEYPVKELLALGRLPLSDYNGLVQVGYLEEQTGSIARGYYRSCLYQSLEHAKAQKFHCDWIKVIDGSDGLPEEMRERLLIYHHYRSGGVTEAMAASMRLAELLQSQQELAEAASVLEFACSLKDDQTDLRLYITLLLQRADLLNRLGEFTAALSVYSRVIRFGRRLDCKEVVASAYKRLGDVYKGRRDYRRGSRALDRAVRYYGEEGNELELSHCYNNIGNICWINGELERATNNYEKALTIQRALSAQRDIASTLSNLGSIRCLRQDFDGGIPMYKESVEIKKRLNDLPELARTYNNLSVAYFEQDQLTIAHDYLKQAFDINETIGANSELHYNYDNFFEIEFRRGNYAKAREWLIEGLKNSRPEAHSVRGGFITSLAGLSILEGRYAKAGALLAAARAREAKVTDRLFSMKVAATCSEYYFNLNDFATSYNFIETATEYAEKIGETKSHAAFLIRRARIERVASRPSEEARASLAQAEEFLAPLSAKREKLELILEHSELALSIGDTSEVERLLMEAVDYPEFDGSVTFRSKLYLLRGILETQRGNFGRAVHFINDAMLTAKSLRMPEMLWHSLLIMGDCQQQQHQLEQSLKAYIEAFDIVKQLAGEISDKRLRKLYLSDKRKGMLGKRLEEMSLLVA